jgi:Zn-dependent M16 (insulinase) family peptidase
LASDPTFLATTLRDFIVTNQHRCTLHSYPDSGMLSRQDAAEAQALSEVWRGMDAAAVAQLKADNDALLQRQQTQETPEQLACIPSLQVPCVCVCVWVCVCGWV